MHRFFLGGCALILAVSVGAEPVCWPCGEWDESGVPSGKLLSDNAGYWGESILTGVTYSYAETPTNPPDRYRGDSNVFGRRLLDGNVDGDWHIPVGTSRRPLTVVFDFKRPCRFSEVDLYASRTPEYAATLEFSADGKSWGGKVENRTGGVLNRIRLEEPAEGRFLKLTFHSDKKFNYIDEVLAWGDGTVSDEFPEDIRPLAVPGLAPGSRQSLRGVKNTVFSEKDFSDYRKKLGRAADLPVLWDITAESTPGAPVFPVPGARLELLMARNETESAYLTLTNPSPDRTVTVDVTPPETPGIDYEVRVGGVLPVNPPARKLTARERQDLFITGVLPPDAEPKDSMQVLPFFAPGEMLPPNLMRRYLANAENILHFPELRLGPGESVVLMLRVSTRNARPGDYRTALAARTPDGKTVSLPLELRVLNLELPDMPVWVRAWGPLTREFPFETRTRVLNDARLLRELGANVVYGLPEPGTKAEAFRRTGRTFHRLPALPGGFGRPQASAGKYAPDKLTPEQRNAIAAHIKGLAEKAKALNVPYDEWFVELWDEPGEKDAEAYGVLSRVIKEVDPQVRIYMNPCFWRPGFPPQGEIVRHLEPYYNRLIDVSCPIMNLVGENQTTRELWAQPRTVNALYLHPARRAGRGISWRSFRYGMNGWGYYCYFSPRGNPWDILTWGSLGFAYQMVFPLHTGAAITPVYETMREGAEDYRLLSALRQHGKTKILDELLREQSQKGCDYRALRDKAMKAFSQ